MGGEGRGWVEREGMGGEGRGWVEREGKRKGLRRVAIGLGFQEDKATSWL